MTIQKSHDPIRIQKIELKLSGEEVGYFFLPVTF